LPINLIPDEEKLIADKKIVFSTLFSLGMVIISLAIIFVIIGGLYFYVKVNAVKAEKTAKKYDQKLASLKPYEDLINRVNQKAEAANKQLSEHIQMHYLIKHIAQATPDGDIDIKSLDISDEEKIVIISGQVKNPQINIPRTYANLLSQYTYANDNNDNKEKPFSEVILKSVQFNNETKTADFTITAEYSDKVYKNE